MVVIIAKHTLIIPANRQIYWPRLKRSWNKSSKNNSYKRANRQLPGVLRNKSIFHPLWSKLDFINWIFANRHFRRVFHNKSIFLPLWSKLNFFDIRTEPLKVDYLDYDRRSVHFDSRSRLLLLQLKLFLFKYTLFL